jgi:hypothetical protein
MMLTKSEALELVSQKLQKMTTPDDPFVVVDAGTIEKPFGWVFFYNSKRYLETEDYRYALAGNGPVIVNKHDGAIEFFGTVKPPAEFIAEYESKLGELRRSQ